MRREIVLLTELWLNFISQSVLDLFWVRVNLVAAESYKVQRDDVGLEAQNNHTLIKFTSLFSFLLFKFHSLSRRDADYFLSPSKR